VPFSLVAERLEVSETQIRKRYSRMVDSGAVRVMALTDPRSLGFHTMAWLAIVGSRGVRLEALADELAKLPSITYLVLCTCRFDIFAEVVCHDIEDLLALLDRDIRPMPELTRVEAMLCLDLYYRRVVPPV
jgi:DNA-binding Lrp family transcriptional regulator